VKNGPPTGNIGLGFRVSGALWENGTAIPSAPSNQSKPPHSHQRTIMHWKPVVSDSVVDETLSELTQGFHHQLGDPSYPVLDLIIYLAIVRSCGATLEQQQHPPVPQSTCCPLLLTFF